MNDSGTSEQFYADKTNLCRLFGTILAIISSLLAVTVLLGVFEKVEKESAVQD